MIETFSDAAAAAAFAAGAITDALTYRLRLRGDAFMVVTGGRSPGPVYDSLAGTGLDWAKVRITLSDERFVDIDSPDSNEKLVRERLLRKGAARAQFVSLRGTAETPQAAAEAASAALADWPTLDVVLLGMGDDGHIASLFPDSPALPLGLDRAAPPCIAVPQGEGRPPSLPRLSLSLARLAASRLVIIVASGAEKRRMLERALDPGDATELPVRALIKAAPTVRLLWSV
jgi:6-phosphogluconolactonase